MINFNFVADLSVEVQINSKFKEKRLGQVSSEYSKALLISTYRHFLNKF